MTALAAAATGVLALLSCVPDLAYFCGNIHIGCAGRTTVPAQAFTVSARRVGFADGTLWPVRFDGALPVVLRRSGHRDWIRVETDGRFSQRIYRGNRAMMMRGRCRPTA